MNLLAFVFVLAGLILGVVILVTTGIKNLGGWALVLISLGVLIQEVAVDWSHTIHT